MPKNVGSDLILVIVVQLGVGQGYTCLLCFLLQYLTCKTTTAVGAAPSEVVETTRTYNVETISIKGELHAHMFQDGISIELRDQPTSKLNTTLTERERVIYTISLTDIRQSLSILSLHVCDVSTWRHCSVCMWSISLKREFPRYLATKMEVWNVL